MTFGTAYSTDRSISWTPPLVISPTAVGQIRVEARDASNSVLSQAFSGTFTFNLSLTGLTPSQVIQAYGISNIKFGSTPGDGTGQTIAIIDLGDDSAIENDLAVFDQEFGLAAPPSFKVVGETGGALRLTPTPPITLSLRAKPQWTSNGPMLWLQAQTLCSSS